MAAPTYRRAGSASGSRAEGTVRWLDDDEQQVWRAYLEMQTKLHAQLNRDMLADAGLSRVQYAVLVQLSEHPGERMRVLELARALQWEKSRLSHQLTRMERQGLIERSHCSEDRRGAFVVLTAGGRAAVDAAAPGHVAAVRRHLFDSLTPDQVTALGSIAAAVVERLDAACAGHRDPCDAEPDEPCG